MDQNSKKKASRSCSCDMCKYVNAKGYGKFTHKQAERKYRHEANEELKKAVQLTIKDLEENTDIPPNYNSPYTA